MKALHARDGAEWRDWLQRNHSLEPEIWLLFYKKGARESGVDYDEAVDLALCFGWIDSMIRRIDEFRYARKFTPRKRGSMWSESNISRVERLIKEGKMTEHGMVPFKEGTSRSRSPGD